MRILLSEYEREDLIKKNEKNRFLNGAGLAQCSPFLSLLGLAAQ